MESAFFECVVPFEAALSYLLEIKMVDSFISISERPIDRNNYNAIDLGKFIAALLVIMIHVYPFGSSNDYTIRLLNYGIQHWFARIAVPFFFMCSGFFLYKKTTVDSFTVKPTKKSVFHLLKLYLIWTIIYFPLKLRAFLEDPKGISHAVLGYIRDCVFTGSYTQLWYIPATIFAVVLISLLLSRKAAPKRIVLFALFAYMAGLLAQSWFGIIRPLKVSSPAIWHFLKTIQKVIVTTRDGFFDGFFFVGLGMLFAFYDINIPKKKALIGFICSFALMFVEAFALKYFDYVRARDMYLFLIPSAFFCFSFILQTELPDSSVFLELRMLSSLIFYSHLLVSKGLTLIYEPLSKSPLLFVLTTTITVIGSYFVIKLSEKKHFGWLKALYR